MAAAIVSIKCIEEQLDANKVKRDVDVIELYLGKSSHLYCYYEVALYKDRTGELYLCKRNLKKVCNLKRFRNLQRVWLNKNKLRCIDCFTHNLRITELYLQHNEIIDITGSLSHLTTLRVLMLHNNQLEKLEKVVRELIQMQDLKVLNLFHNPVSQESGYRLYVIHHLPSVELLDQKEVLLEEREAALSIYNQQREAVKETIGFGRRSEGRPDIFYPIHRDKLESTVPVNFEVGNNFYRNNPPFENEEDAINVRLLKKSCMDYSKFDWSKVPRSEERRVIDKPFETPQIITVRFR